MPSTAIADLSYDPRQRCLTVTFITGRIYQYFEVPPDVAGAFATAASKGAFFNREIRGRYAFREITRGTVRRDTASGRRTASRRSSSPRAAARSPDRASGPSGSGRPRATCPAGPAPGR